MSAADIIARGLAIRARATSQLFSRRIAMLGDSFHAPPTSDALAGYGYVLSPFAAPTLVQRRSTSMMAWLQTLSGQQFEYGVKQDKAVSGNTTTQMLARFDSDIAPLKAGILVYCGGTNDGPAGVLPDQTIANDLAIIAKARALGMRVFMGGIAPRNAWSDSPTITVQNQRRHWIRQVNARRQAIARVTPGVSYVDFMGVWADATSTTGGVIAQYVQSDGLHPSNEGGGFWLGWALWQAFRAAGFVYLPETRNDGMDPTVVSIDTASNPYVNRLPNPTLQGTGGTLVTVTGTAPASWTVSRSSGSTGAAVGAQVARPDGLTGNVYQLTMTASAGAINEQFQLQPSAIVAPVPGETWAASIGISVTSAVNFRGANLRLQFLDASNAVLLEIWCFDATGKLPNMAWNGVLRTEPWTVPTGATQAKLYIRLTVDGTLSGTATAVTVSDAFLGRVPLTTGLDS